MKFDTIIIGGGLSGLVAGIRLQQEGQRCAIISSGQSALHFSSGSYDLLNTLADGEQVTNPLFAIDKLIKQSPSHPYSKLGASKFRELANKAELFFKELDVPLSGTANNNHYRITPMGTLKSTWLSSFGFAITLDNQMLPWKKVAIFNPIGFLDFYPQFIADEFLKLGTESDLYEFTLPDIDHLRRNPSELRATNIARVFNKKENVEALALILKIQSKDSEAIIFPACIGLEDHKALEHLIELVGKPVFLLPTMPPSIVGIHTQQYLKQCFEKLGGVYMLGDNIMKADVVDNKVTKLYSYNHGDIPFIPKNVILATGSYFSQGLIGTSDSVYEPILNLDVDYSGNRNDWYNKNVFEKQNYQSYGVKTDDSFKGLCQNKAIDNLYVSGAILEGFNPIKEGCGAGVSILTALSVVENILSK